MPSTVSNLFRSVGLAIKGTVRWNTIPTSNMPGLYVVTMDSSPDTCINVQPNPPIDEQMIQFWIDRVPSVLVDEVPPTVPALKSRLSEFWYPDETILYIGRTGNRLGNRVKQYYKHILGDKRPHRGGHWLKTLSILNKLYIHYADTNEYDALEKELLSSFMENVSEKSKKMIRDSEALYPFANLEGPGEGRSRRRKKHGISRQTHS